MGLLEQLKQQADAVQMNQRMSQEERVQKLRQAHAHMNQALHYWLEFFKALNVLKPPIRRRYFIEGTSTLEDLVQCDYNVNSRRITVDHHDYIDSIELRFRCVSNEKLTIEKESNVVVTRLREHLWQHGLKFEAREIRREGAYVERGIFTIFGDVTARLTIASDVDHGVIKLTVRNLERLGEYTYVYDYDEFSPELFEQIGNAILAQPNQLRRIGRHQASTTAAWAGPHRRDSDAPRAARSA